jgi:hypothetical protein
MTELDKLERALWAALAGCVDGRARDLFGSLDDLRFARDLVEGRLTADDGGMVTTGIDEFLRQSVRQGYELLGIAQAA